MPAVSGLELQNILAEKDSFLPIIFLTAHGTETMRVQTLQAGAVAFFTKPFSDTALLEAIHTALAPDHGSL